LFPVSGASPRRLWPGPAGADPDREALVKTVFDLNCRIVPDPFFGTPLCIPFGRELPR